VGQLVQTELGRILHSGIIKGDAEYIDDELRRRISIVSVDISPDLRQARVTVSVRKSSTSDDNPVVDKRRAYSWLVENTKPLRHSLAQKMSHMKTSPTLTFVQVDVGAAVDVMYLIDKVSSGYQRERIGEYGEDDSSVSNRFVDGMDFDEEFDEDDWEEEDDDFFDDSE
jgi:ribosome-binding factor A